MQKGGASGCSPERKLSGWAADALSVKRYDALRHHNLRAALVLALFFAAVACEDAPRYATGVAVTPGEDAGQEDATDVSMDASSDVSSDISIEVDGPPDAAPLSMRLELVNVQTSPLYLQTGITEQRWLAGFEAEGEALQPVIEDCLCPCDAAPCDLDCAAIPGVVALAEGEAWGEPWDGKRRFIERHPTTGERCIASAPASPADALNATFCWGASVLEIGSGDYAQEVVCDTVALSFVAGGLHRYEAQAPNAFVTLRNGSGATRYVQVGDELGHAAWYRFLDADGRQLAVEEDCGVPECHRAPTGVCGAAEPQVRAVPPGGSVEVVWRGQTWQQRSGRCEAPYVLRSGDITAEVCWSDAVQGGAAPPDGEQGGGVIAAPTCQRGVFSLESASVLRFEIGP